MSKIATRSFLFLTPDGHRLVNSSWNTPETLNSFEYSAAIDFVGSRFSTVSVCTTSPAVFLISIRNLIFSLLLYTPYLNFSVPHPSAIKGEVRTPVWAVPPQMTAARSLSEPSVNVVGPTTAPVKSFQPSKE